MTESSETWHDNAPGEAIKAESDVLTHRAKATASILSNGKIFEYPSTEFSMVTLGSVVGYSYSPDASSHVYITGQTRDVPSCIMNQLLRVLRDEDIEIATLRSPLARALLGKCVSETFSFSPGRHKQLGSVTQIIQFNPSIR